MYKSLLLLLKDRDCTNGHFEEVSENDRIWKNKQNIVYYLFLVAKFKEEQ